MNSELLSILVCPETKAKLNFVSTDVLNKLNQLIIAHKLKNRAGVVIEQKIEAGLIRADNKILYPIRNGIPIMLLDEGIALDNLIFAH